MGSGYADGRAKPGHCDVRYYWRPRSDSDFLLLRRRRHLAVGRLRIGRLGRVGRLVQTLDLGLGAELADEVGLGLAGDVGLDLGLDLGEVRRLAAALLLDLDDVPAELRLHGVGDLARLEH